MNSPLKILYVEDDASEVELAKLAASADGIDIEFHVLEDGEAAVRYIHSHGPANAPFRPDFILLDLNLPRIKGHEVLRMIRKNSDWASTPVVVLSGGITPRERELLEGTNPDAVLAKGEDFNGYCRVFREIADFWRSRTN